MKKTKQILTALFLAVLVISVLCVPAFALTESEVEAQIASSSKEAVTGNVLLWFLCAVAFLKVSQKIDSFMATLGVNVGHTGGSMLAEAMIAMRAVTMVVGGGHGAGAGRAGTAAGSMAGKSGTSGMAGFFKGGLVGMAGRHITNSAVRTATTQTSAVHTAQNQVQQAASAATAAQTAADTRINSEVHTGGSSIHTENGIPAQDGIILTGGGADSPAIPMEGAPSDSIPTNMSQPYEGGGTASQIISPESTQSASQISCGIPPQEGVILTGSEPSAAVPQADPTPQSVSTPPESLLPDMSQPQEGMILTGGEHSVHAAQTENIFGGDADGTVHVNNTAAAGGGQHTQVHTEQTRISHTSASGEKVQTNHVQAGAGTRPTLGGMVFSRSLAAGGSFANDIIGTVARGEVAGRITGDMAAQSLQSYLGYTAESKAPPIFSSAEIGGGRIAGYVSTPELQQPTAFGMYHADQYMEPTGTFSKIRSADGSLWYTQLAQDTVERKPYKAPDGSVAYHENIVKKLPNPPRRKDQV